MSTWYALAGTIRLRMGPEVDRIVASIRDHCGAELDVGLAPADAGCAEFSIGGAGELPACGVLLLEGLLRSLGPHALEGVVQTGAYDGAPCELVVGPTEEARALALSRHRFGQIWPLARELVARDRDALIAWLREPRA
jgi:hypothetical protein